MRGNMTNIIILSMLKEKQFICGWIHLQRSHVWVWRQRV